MEEQQKVTFVQDTSPKILKQVKRFYHICHRSFFPRQKQNPKRHPKNIGSNKIERACPAMIIASMGDTIVDVQFFETHVGHACEIGRNQLSRADRNRLAGKHYIYLSLGIVHFLICFTLNILDSSVSVLLLKVLI